MAACESALRNSGGQGGTIAGQACSTIGNLKCVGDELFFCALDLTASSGNIWQSRGPQTNCAATCQAEASRAGKACEGTTAAGTTPGAEALPPCQQCLARNTQQSADARVSWLWCDQSSQGVFSSTYLTGNPSQPGQCISYAKAGEAINIQRDRCQSSLRGTSVENAAACPPVRQCSEQCRAAYSGRGLVPGLNAPLSGQYNPYNPYNPYNSYYSSPLNSQGYNVAFGQCSDSAQSSINLGFGGAQAIQTGTLQGRGPAVGCSGAEYCNCFATNPAGAVSAFGQFGSNSLSGTLPGTTQLPNWNDPAALQNYPSAQPNQLDCDAPSDASVTAEISPRLAQAGETVTVSGEVGKIASTCTGYQRTCRAIRQQSYKASRGFLKDTYEIQQCPSELPQVIHKECLGQEGKDSCSDWHITTIVILAAVAAFATYCAFGCTSLLNSLGLTKTTTGAVTSAEQVAGGVGAGATTATAATSINWAKLLPILLSAPATAAAFKNQFRSLFGSQYQQTQQKPSFSVCAKEYKTGIGANPLCSQGGNVIGFKEGRYTCNAGSCEAFAGKEIKIIVYAPNGEAIASTTTRTDAAGTYSHSFTAPGAEGEYSAVVAVPGINRNPATGTLGSIRRASEEAGSGAAGEQAVRPLSGEGCTEGMFPTFAECALAHDAAYCSQCSGLQPLS